MEIGTYSSPNLQHKFRWGCVWCMSSSPLEITIWVCTSGGSWCSREWFVGQQKDVNVARLITLRERFAQLSQQLGRCFIRECGRNVDGVSSRPILIGCNAVTADGIREHLLSRSLLPCSIRQDTWSRSWWLRIHISIVEFGVCRPRNRLLYNRLHSLMLLM